MSLSVKNIFGSFRFFLGLAIILWVYSFWVFLSREAAVISDAVSFYDHTKFYVDNISRGVYPFWDPLWSCGSPNEFFLRRIGPFNPFLFLIVVPYKLGLPYWPVFAAFLTFYFFLGMTGFYKLVLEVLKDKSMAIIAFVLLTFSSLGTRVFDSYVMMFMTPLIWFFYFGFVFGRTGHRSALLGMVFCTMLLMTTYIPFYFLVVLLTFVIFFVPFFPKETLNFAKNGGHFIKRHPVLFVLCLMALGLSCAPGILFFKAAAEGIFAMPLRHFNALDPHALTVKADVTTYWAIPEDLLYSSFYLEDLRQFDFAVFYVPFFTIILFVIGIVTKVNRKTFFIFMWGSFLFAMGSPYLFGLYDFLHNHIFFFKYFRNLHFFLWLVLLPLFIVFVVEQMRMFLKMLDKNPQRKPLAFLFILAVHVALGTFLFWQQNFNYSSWIVLALSLVIFCCLVRRRLSLWVLCCLCFLTIVIQPLEAYHHLKRNVLKYLAFSVYDQFHPQFQYTRTQKTIVVMPPVGQTAPALEGKNNPLYFGTQWFNLLWDKMDFKILQKYTFNKFVLYDNVSAFDEKRQDLLIVQEAWAKNLNVAFVPEKSGPEISPGGAAHALVIEKESPQLRVLDSNVNHVKLLTNLPMRKFLVFNDGYYPGWHASINGKETPLYRANIAFKGLWVPSGKQEVEFRFGISPRYLLEPFLVGFYFLFLVVWVWPWKKDRSVIGAKNV